MNALKQLVLMLLTVCAVMLAVMALTGCTDKQAQLLLGEDPEDNPKYVIENNSGPVVIGDSNTSNDSVTAPPTPAPTPEG